MALWLIKVATVPCLVVFDILISHIDYQCIDSFWKYQYQYIDKDNLENIDIDKAILESININKKILENIDIDKGF